MPRPKKEGKKNIRKDISMDPEQYERLIDYCRQQDRPISWVIRQALDEYLPAQSRRTLKTEYGWWYSILNIREVRMHGQRIYTDD